jgi:hypothetical protein
MINKITLDMLTQDSVSVKIQRYYDDNGTLYPVGQPHRKAYVNSVRGRQEVEKEIEEPYKTIIFIMWGDKPTITE